MKKNNILRISLIILIILLIGIIIFVVIESKNNNKSVNEIIDQEIPFKTSGEEDMFTVNSIEDYDADNDEKMKKVSVTIKNDSDENIKTNVYLFHLADTDKNELGLCYTRNLKYFFQNDMLPLIADSNSETTGYIYCNTSDIDEKYLKITYATKGYIDENGKFSIDKKDIYVEIK